MGIEADISFGSVGEKWIDPDPNSGYYTEDKVTALGTLRARLGYAADRFMPYVTGGLAIGKSKHVLGCETALVVNPGTGGCTAGTATRVEFENSGSDTSTGYVVGFGGEYAVTDNWTLKAEYLYTDLGKNSVSLYDPNWNTLTERKFDTNFSTVRVGVNYKF